jgi:transposase
VKEDLMAKDIIAMSLREIDRFRIVQGVMQRDLTQIKAAEVLGITDRHIRRLVRRVRDEGARGIVHRSRGRASPHRMLKDFEERIVEVVEERYAGFGPTLAAEKLFERDGIRISKEKLRQIMMVHGLWQKKRRRREIHPWRERKDYFGEMIQMDGSHHAWLEGRGPRLVLMGYVDDANNNFFGHFYGYEGVYPAMDSLERYISLYGLPRSLYLDKHSTFKTTREPSLDELLRGERALTQFERACKQLGIEVIHAHSPQAKGRIERTFGILQDRLVKEMRLASIRTEDQANRFLEKFLPRFNERFVKVAKKESDLHRSLPKGVNPREIFCIKATRTINHGFIVKWRGRQLLIESVSIAIRRRKVEIREHFDGEITIKFNGRYLKYREIMEPKPAAREKVKRPVDEPRKRKGKYIPPPDHPWKRHDPSLHHNSYLERII